MKDKDYENWPVWKLWIAWTASFLSHGSQEYLVIGRVIESKTSPK